MTETGAASRATSVSTTSMSSRIGGSDAHDRLDEACRADGSATRTPTIPAISRTAGTIANSAA